MERRRFEPTWPFLCVLLGLFVLSATSSRLWRGARQGRSAPSDVTAKVAPPGAATPAEARPDDRGDIVVLEPAADLAGAVAEADWTVPSAPSPEESVRSIGRFETIEPAPRLAGPAVDVEVSAPALIAPVLPSRGTPASQQRQRAGDSAWLPVPSLAGPMPLVDDAPFDAVVLPVRRPDRSPTAAPGEQVASDWPEPKVLLERLDELAWECETGAWAREVARQVAELGRAVSDASPAAASILSELYDLGLQADQLAARLTDRGMATRLLRAEHAFGRRMDLWRRLIVPGKPLADGWHVSAPGSSGRVDAAELLRRLERYESTGLSRDAEPVAEVCRWLTQSPAAEHQRFNRRLQTHYRNANLRLSVTGELLNRLIPERKPQQQQVRDTVLGRPVYGRSTNESELAVRLIPDPRRLRVALEVEGRVFSRTTSTSGPATFYSDSKSTYLARKEMELGTWGIRVWPARVTVDNAMWLRSWETSLDGLPLVGPLVHGVARNQHDRKSPLADREVEDKVASRVKQQFDEESEQRLRKFSDVLQAQFFQPLARMSLSPVTVSAQTTDRRMVTRVRLATDDQLGSSTPRPEAPTDSLLSLQIHQSAINNLLEQLELDGRTFTLGELRRHIAAKLNRPEMAQKTTEQDDVVIAFAARDAVHVEFGEGRTALSISVARLSRSPHRWSNFQVRVFYRPEVQDRTARLVRDGVIQLIGRLNIRSQIALRGIFSKTFHKDRSWVITPDRLQTDPVFDPTAITQLVIDDGWLGFALGPARPDAQVAAVRRKADRID